MREVCVEELTGSVVQMLRQVESDRLVLTRHGKPVAMMVSLRKFDAEDIDHMTDPEFSAMIQERRKASDLVPLAQVVKDIEKREAAQTRHRPAAKSQKKTAKKGKRNGTARDS